MPSFHTISGSREKYNRRIQLTRLNRISSFAYFISFHSLFSSVIYSCFIDGHVSNRIYYLCNLIKNCDALYPRLVFMRLTAAFIYLAIYISCICMCSNAYANSCVQSLTWFALVWKLSYNMCTISRHIVEKQTVSIFPFILTCIK